MNKQLIKNRKNMFLIIGTGRSGTCWLGDIVSKSSDISTTIEDKSIFPLVVKMALDSSKKTKLIPKLVSLYEKNIQNCNKVYVDKSHPNIWLVEDLLHHFPKVKFIGIQRDVLQTVSSMMQHGLRNWGKTWEKYPIPNSFLGVNEITKKDYKNSSLISRCVYRYVSHYKRLEYLKQSLKNKLHVISYDNLILNHEEEIGKLSRFIGVKIPSSSPNTKSLCKYKKRLSSEQIKEIENTFKRLIKI
jgi:hypothetical protein